MSGERVVVPGADTVSSVGERPMPFKVLDELERQRVKHSPRGRVRRSGSPPDARLRCAASNLGDASARNLMRRERGPGGAEMRRGVAVAAVVSAAGLLPLPIAAAASVTWSTSFTPPRRSGYEVAGFAARSTVDVWAVGLRPGGRCQFQTLTQHWDGSTWNVVPSPNNSTVNSVLDGVTVVGT